MAQVQNRLPFLIALALFFTGCTKQQAGETAMFRQKDFRPDPAAYSAPSCNIDENTLSSPLDNFDGLKFTFSAYIHTANHNYIFTNNNGDSLVISLFNIFDVSCNYTVVESPVWQDNSELPLKNMAVYFRMNKSAGPKMTGWIGNGACNALYNAGQINMQCCVIRSAYTVLPGVPQQYTNISFNLKMPFIKP